jgi:hypothetical protein
MSRKPSCATIKLYLIAEVASKKYRRQRRFRCGLKILRFKIPVFPSARDQFLRPSLFGWITSASHGGTINDVSGR